MVYPTLIKFCWNFFLFSFQRFKYYLRLKQGGILQHRNVTPDCHVGIILVANNVFHHFYGALLLNFIMDFHLLGRIIWLENLDIRFWNVGFRFLNLMQDLKINFDDQKNGSSSWISIKKSIKLDSLLFHWEIWTRICRNVLLNSRLQCLIIICAHARTAFKSFFWILPPPPHKKKVNRH